MALNGSRRENRKIDRNRQLNILHSGEYSAKKVELALVDDLFTREESRQAVRDLYHSGVKRGECAEDYVEQMLYGIDFISLTQASRTVELRLLEDMTITAVARVPVDFGNGAYCTEYREDKGGGMGQSLRGQTWGGCRVYEYSFTGAGSSTHPASSVQKVIIGERTPTTTSEKYTLIVKKVDSSNPTRTVAISGTAANGYHLVNRADAGGKYQVLGSRCSES